MALRKSWTELDSEAISQREPGFTPNSVFKSDPIYDVVYWKLNVTQQVLKLAFSSRNTPV